jgi:2-phospho-L-lactate transferase/gluconeogenesis factor (CofD/UPF0052 family)
LATRFFRTEAEGGMAAEPVTAEISRRCKVSARILPMTDDSVRTFVAKARTPALPFQEYFVRRARGRADRVARPEQAVRCPPRWR